MKLPKWTREPLVHFLIGGAAIFAVFAWIGEPVDPASRAIDVDRSQQAQLSLQFERTMQRPPTDAELDALIESWVRDEVLYREAFRLGLDQDDAVVRRRLSQKMDFIASSQAEAAEPDDAVLEQWLTDHAARFTTDSRLSFDQLWFAERPEAEAVLEGLIDDDWRDLGQSISLPASFENRRRTDVAAQLGRDFVRELDGLEADDSWTGPVVSGLGWHVVRLRQSDPGTVPPLAEIRDKVLADWRTSTASKRREEAYQLLRDAYQIEIAE